MTSLSDTQRILLAHAAQAESGSVLPLPATLKPSGGTSKAITALINRALVEERETSEPSAVRRAEDDARYGVYITAAGLASIGVEPRDQPATPVAVAPAAPKTTKTAAVIALLTRPEGATMPELIGATGWLPHTTHAALTGLCKKGHAVARSTRDGATCYRIASAT